MSGSIILVSEREEDFVFAAEVAKQCSADLVLASDLKKLEEVSAAEGSFQALFLGFANTEAIQTFKTSSGRNIARDKVHAIVSPSDADVALASFQSGAVGSVVINRFSNPLNDGEYYSRIVRASGMERCFGLKSFLQPVDGIQTVKLTNSVQKGFAANSVAYHLRELKCNERIARTVAGAVDELLMNAMFDAPVGKSGERLHDRTPRDATMAISGVEMQIGVEEDLIAVTVKDTSGSLDRDTVLGHVSRSFDPQLNKVRGPEYQGAGIGLSLVIRSGGSMAFVCEPGKRTEVTVFFRQAEKFKDFRNPFQFVSTRVY